MIPEGENQKDYAYKAIEMLLNDLNIMGSDKPIVEGVVEALRMNHRTLQQNFWRMMLEVIKQYSEFRHDLRNEASVELCKFFTEKLKEDEGKTYLPFV
jgi:hypothetical protein